MGIYLCVPLVCQTISGEFGMDVAVHTRMALDASVRPVLYWPEMKTLAFIGMAQRQRATPHWHTCLTLKHMQHSGQHLACLWHFIRACA